jgi:hypothetical protein
MRTCLGKLVVNLLELWHEQTSVRLKLSNAEVKFREDGNEFIAGEQRAAMDVMCTITVEYAASLSKGVPPAETSLLPQKKRLSSNRIPDLKSVDTEEANMLVRQISSPSSTGSASIAAIRSWMNKIKPNAEDMEHTPSRLDAVPSEIQSGRCALNCMVQGIQALQDERSSSCLALASGKNAETGKQLDKQRCITDVALDNAQRQTHSSVILSVTASLKALRTTLDQSNGSELCWEERYKHICTKPRHFNTLIGMLVEHFLSACKINPGVHNSMVESIGLFCYFGEELSRERAFVHCRGDAKAVDPGKEMDGKRSMVLMSTSRSLILDLLDTNKRFTMMFQQLRKEESKLLAIDNHDPESWFRLSAACIKLIQGLIDSLLGDEEGCIKLVSMTRTNRGLPPTPRGSHPESSQFVLI